ncbi:tRNA (adenosine(37)-N6)-dimethylallyltransferase MiaA [Proteiniclasticum sp. QWL-01]|nr:tRNA (adenosine(37)-N6)-dimethylallyltransferase MiaA [Proteiniclasticum sp. QWL-01]WFF71449.1 tRNA (adenosine(37)-N6)-dimethylallyltransferase MiaA [Proteiniclasticum sp. QWL-01]
MMERRVIVLAGPTGVGKSDLAVKLAQRLNGEIISCDSMQIYRGMDIGSAKIKPEDMRGVPHHLLDFLDPATAFSAAEYQTLALKTIEQIHERGHIAILTGGTGLYINSVIYPLGFTAADRSDEIRRKYEDVLRDQGREALHQLLQQQDPVSAGRIHANNVKRVIRALEVQEMTGRAFSEYGEEKVLRQDLEIYYYWISMDRARLYDRINRRVDVMMAEGLLEEVRSLQAQGLGPMHQSMQGIGYKELLHCLEGKVSLEEAVDQIRQGSRNYAKRQMTWFRNDPNCAELSKELMTDEQMVAKIESDVSTHQTPKK